MLTLYYTLPYFIYGYSRLLTNVSYYNNNTTSAGKINTYEAMNESYAFQIRQR